MFGGFGVADLSWNLAHDLWVRSGGDGQRRDGEKERTVAVLEGVITVKVPPSCSGDICLFRQVQQGRHRTRSCSPLLHSAAAALCRDCPKLLTLPAGSLRCGDGEVARRRAAAGSIEM